MNKSYFRRDPIRLPSANTCPYLVIDENQVSYIYTDGKIEIIENPIGNIRDFTIRNMIELGNYIQITAEEAYALYPSDLVDLSFNEKSNWTIDE